MLNRVMVVLVASIVLGARAESQYPNVAYGDVVTIAESQDRSNASIAGKLIVTGGTTQPEIVTFGSPIDEGQDKKTPACIEVNGGTFGSAHSKQTPTTVKLGENGGRGQFVVKSGTFGVAVLDISSSTAPGDDGYIDFARLEGGTAKFRSILNNSSFTGRVTVAGNVKIGAEHAQYPTMHSKGATLWECANGVTVTFDGGNQYCTVNSANVPVRIVGNADFKFTLSNYSLSFNEGFSLETTGTATFSGKGPYYISGSGVLGSNLSGIVLGANTQLSFGANSTNSVANVTSGSGASLIGSGVLLADVASGSKTFAVEMCGKLILLKRGAGELVVDTTPQVPNLVLEDGTVRFVRDCVVSNVTVKAGTRLVADGVKVVLMNEPENADALEAVNGGSFSLLVGSDSGVSDVRHCVWNHELVKTGAGEVRLYDPLLSGRVHVEEGKVSFSRLGLRDRYLKFTMKELLPFYYDGKESPLKGWCGHICFYDTDGVLSTKESGNLTFELGKHPTGLTLGEVTAPLGTIWETSGSYCYVYNTFRKDKNPYIWKTGAITNADDKVNFLVLYYRLPDTSMVAAAIDGINVYSTWTYGNPKCWTVESSATGEDGTWRTILDKNEKCAGMHQSRSYWLNGSDMVDTPAYLFTYAQSGVQGLADTLQAQVDADATLDFTAKDGGQAIAAITIDFERGGGVLKGAKLAASGTLYLVNATKDLLKLPLPLVLEDLGGSDNLKNWNLVINGVSKDRCLKYDAESGKLTVVPNGLMLLFR